MERAEHRLALIEWHSFAGAEAHAAAHPSSATVERMFDRVFDVRQWPLTIGRALDNDIVLDDPHVAAHHARLEPDAEGRLLLVAPPTLNGVWLEGRRVDGPALLPADAARLQMGTTMLRLRLAGQPVSPELPLAGQAVPSARAGRAGRWRGPNGLAWAAGLGVFVLQLASLWVRLDPGADYAAWLPVAFGLPAAIATWCAMWALMSKLFRHRFDFVGHLRIVLPWLFAMSLADLLWPQIGAAVAAPHFWMLASPLQALLGAFLVGAHLAHVLPLHRRAVALTLSAVVVAAGALTVARNYRSSDSFSSEPYMSTLPIPPLRLAGTVPAMRLVQDIAPLAAQLAQTAKKAREDDPAGGEED